MTTKKEGMERRRLLLVIHKLPSPTMTPNLPEKEVMDSEVWQVDSPIQGKAAMKAGDKGDRRSTFGYFTLVGGNLVTWRSKKQKVVALSSAEAEFRGIARGLAEVLWIRKLLAEIGFSQTKASGIMCDNKAAIQISENPVQHDRTKHLEVDRHFIKEKLEAGIIELPFVRSEDQLADILTKAVNGRIFNKCLDKLCIGDPTTQLEEEC
ncbi:hypothetical protein E3N88_43956 [Mikania micrantha]|uniref:Copia protein n=1 Tax=Mikania micrantha TaxID=192012 RepID=A0A5N6LDL6_9ASTR|nr:hypothetical protein E3N88_43956 [Mikania micrantha]